MDFDGADVAAIESALDAQRPGGWCRLGEKTLAQYLGIGPRAGWRVDVPRGQVALPGIDHFLLLIDSAFPWSEPRVIAPQATADFTWPHVERGGLLCLKRTRYDAGAADRALACLSYACELLNYGERKRREEFAREFSAYWNQKLPEKRPGPLFLSLVVPGSASRDIFYCPQLSVSRIVLADDRESLKRWLRHAGENPADKHLAKTRLLWLDQPPVPAEYPEFGRDVLVLAPDDTLTPLLRAGGALPVLIGAPTETGPVLVGVLLSGASEDELRRGFRSIAKVPLENVARSYAGRAVQRCRVERVDAAWVHGRDNDPSQATLAEKCVVIVGCGAMGTAVARFLAQAGIGRFILVDADRLFPHNTSRHTLGHRFIGKNKAEATAGMLAEDFPHLRAADPFPYSFEKLNASQLKRIAESDLIVSAGIDLSGDAVLDQWRRDLHEPPSHVCTWVEEYAIVGHAVALVGGDSLFAGITSDGIPAFSLTDWPSDAKTVIVEAGCGNAFQPHGIVDLSASITLATKLALDVLMGLVATSCRRVWQGDRDIVIRLGGAPRPAFAESNVFREFQWL